MLRHIYWTRATLRSKRTGKKSPAESKDSSGSTTWCTDSFSNNAEAGSRTSFGHRKLAVYAPASNRGGRGHRLGDVTAQNLSPLHRGKLLVERVGFSFVIPHG